MRTYLTPDEYFQAIEPAHWIVYRTADLPWELRNEYAPLRSALCFLPSTIALWSIRLAFTTPDPLLKLLAPRITHSLLAALAHLGVHRCSRSLFGQTSASFASVHLLLSWFACDVLVRTPPSSTGACFAASALVFWPWDKRLDLLGTAGAVAFATLAGATHPPAAVPWAFLLLARLWTLRGSERLLYVACCGSIALTVIVRSC